MCAPLSANSKRGAVAFVEEIADQPDLDELAAEQPRLVDLLLRRRHRHEDHAPLAEMAAHEGEALRMVAGRSADEQFGLVAGGKRLAEEIEGAADLVGAHRRQVLALQQHPRAGLLRQIVVFLQRRLRKIWRIAEAAAEKLIEKFASDLS